MTQTPDPTLMKVGKNTKLQPLAHSIADVIKAGQLCDLRAIGPHAINNAVKAIAVARGLVAPAGFDLAFVPAFEDLALPEGERTAIRLKVILR